MAVVICAGDRELVAARLRQRYLGRVHTCAAVSTTCSRTELPPWDGVASAIDTVGYIKASGPPNQNELAGFVRAAYWQHVGIKRGAYRAPDKLDAGCGHGKAHRRQTNPERIGNGAAGGQVIGGQEYRGLRHRGMRQNHERQQKWQNGSHVSVMIHFIQPVADSRGRAGHA